MRLLRAFLILWIFAHELCAAPAPPTIVDPPFSKPVVKLENGTIAGRHSSSFNQDFFFGIPYASPPVGELRFRRPSPPKAWNGTRFGGTYGPQCFGNSIGLPGYSQSSLNLTMSEDCLHLNIVRPGGTVEKDKIPVLIWIPGGGLVEGGASDRRYNGSFLVEQSTAMGTPIIFVSINYRLGVFGLLAGAAMERAGQTNLALHDQRQALAWIQENISRFGGDPSRVTVMGESAGALSVGFHLLAFGGRKDRLFNAAIAESGNAFANDIAHRNASEREADFNMVLEAVGCTASMDPLVCLRAAPPEKLNKAGAQLPPTFMIDGELLPDTTMRLLQEGRFIHVPLLIGSNRNEGTSFTQLNMRGPIETDQDLNEFIKVSWGRKPIPETVMQDLARLYQREIDSPTVAGLGTVSPNPGPGFGSQYGKATLWMGDMLFTAGRRLTSQAWANHGVPSYSYFFDTVPANVDAQFLGAAHFQEIPYVFNNVLATGWEVDPFPADPTLRRQHHKLADIMSRMWISFATTKSPNFHQLSDINVTWPVYSNIEPVNMIFSALNGVSLQHDRWRTEATNLIFRMAKQV